MRCEVINVSANAKNLCFSFYENFSGSIDIGCTYLRVCVESACRIFNCRSTYIPETVIFENIFKSTNLYTRNLGNSILD